MLLGTLYIRRSRRSRETVEAFTALLRARGRR
jgi:hypothetical protein